MSHSCGTGSHCHASRSVALRIGGRLKAGLHEDVQSQREHSILIDGLWLSAPLTLFALDLIYPLVTRTTAQFFTCRDLETPHDGDPHNDDGVPSGWWLEADYRPVDRSPNTLCVEHRIRCTFSAQL